METKVIFVVGCPTSNLLLLKDIPFCVSSYQEQAPASHYKTQRDNTLFSLRAGESRYPPSQ